MNLSTCATCHHFPQNSESVPHHNTTQVYTNYPFSSFPFSSQIVPIFTVIHPTKLCVSLCTCQPRIHRVSLFLFSGKILFLVLPFCTVILCYGFDEVGLIIICESYKVWILMGALCWKPQSLVVIAYFWGPQKGWSNENFKKFGNLFRGRIWGDGFLILGCDWVIGILQVQWSIILFYFFFI